jgi:hypothetical protein
MHSAAAELFPGNEWLMPVFIFGGIFAFLALIWWVSGGLDG